MHRNSTKLFFLPGLVLTAVLVAGLVTSVMTLLSDKGADWWDDVSWGKLESGETTAALAATLKDNLPGGHYLVTADRVSAYLLFHDLGTRVRPGCDNWLFLADELMVYPDAEAHLMVRARMVGQVEQALKEKGVNLVVAVVPDKSRVSGEHLCGVDRPARFESRLGDFVTALRAQKISTVNLLDVLSLPGGEHYYRTDTHWNQPGARLAAEAVAGQLRDAGLAPPPGALWKISMGASQERVGDLIRLAGLSDVAVPYRPKGDMVALQTLEAPAAEGGSDLFGDTRLPGIVDIGTSYSNNSNFVDYISAALSSPVANMARDGGDFSGSAVAYFTNPAFLQTPPKVVIWEIPERVLEQPLTQQEKDWREKLAAGKL
ncbi:MAG: hypothetical protein PW790_10495 [Parvibaculaceae bacterium]|nr:hypothetical protein [Parvibaculaceae bacterium]